jgi:hypothetical protein
MKHPSHEQWMDYLYAETPTEARAELDRHLEVCPDCQANVAEFRSSMQALDEWKLPEAPPQSKALPARRHWHWAAAAVLVLGVGFGLGRWAAPPPDLAALRAQLEPQLRQQLLKDTAAMLASSRNASQQELAALAEALDEQRVADQRSFVKLLKEQDDLQRARVTALRRDLETVAINTDGSLRNAQDEIVRLVSATQPAGR